MSGAAPRGPRAYAGRVCRLLLAAVLAWAASAAATEVLTNNYDAGRTGANLTERILHAGNVRPGSFGRLFSLDVDAAIYAQPLLAEAVVMPGGDRRDLLLVATANNTVYAFDARGGAAPPVWRRTLERLGSEPDSSVRGILGTPVIDRAAGVLYVVAAFAGGAAGHFQLHALDLADGHERVQGPVAVRAAVRVDGVEVAFRPTETRIAVQRAGLALAAGKVIVAFGGDFFEGWVMAYDAADLRAAPAAFCTVCASRVQAVSGVNYLDADCTFLGPGGGIWQAGRAPVVDAQGQVYFFTGNKAHIVRRGCLLPPVHNACASCDQPQGCPCKGVGGSRLCRGPDTCIANHSADGRAFDTNESLVVLDPTRDLALAGWWRPSHWNAAGPEGLERNDLDLGGSGPVLVPGTRRLLGGGKQGIVYLLDAVAAAPGCEPGLQRSCLGPGPNPVQSFAVAPAPPEPQGYYRHILGGPVLWPRPAQAGGTLAFLWRENDHLRSYALAADGQVLGCSTDAPAATASVRCEGLARSAQYIDHHPGGVLTLSADDANPDSGIVWANTSRIGGGPGHLMAFAALPREPGSGRLDLLWDSEACPGDHVEVGADFMPPTVANGRVFLATGGNRVDVFGLLAGRACAPAPAPAGPGPLLQ